MTRLQQVVNKYKAMAEQATDRASNDRAKALEEVAEREKEMVEQRREVRLARCIFIQTSVNLLKAPLDNLLLHLQTHHCP